MPGFENIKNTSAAEGGENEVPTLSAENLEEDLEKVFEGIDFEGVEVEGGGGFEAHAEKMAVKEIAGGDFEAYAEKIAKKEIAQIKNMVKTRAEEELLFGLDAVKTNDYSKQIDQILLTKEKATSHVWKSEIVRLLQEDKSREEFMQRAANNIFKDVEKEIGGEIMKNASTQ